MNKSRMLMYLISSSIPFKIRFLKKIDSNISQINNKIINKMRDLINKLSKTMDKFFK
jgi:hypothetical protein